MHRFDFTYSVIERLYNNYMYVSSFYIVRKLLNKVNRLMIKFNSFICISNSHNYIDHQFPLNGRLGIMIFNGYTEN